MQPLLGADLLRRHDPTASTTSQESTIDAPGISSRSTPHGTRVKGQQQAFSPFAHTSTPTFAKVCSCQPLTEHMY